MTASRQKGDENVGGWRLSGALPANADDDAMVGAVLLMAIDFMLSHNLQNLLRFLAYKPGEYSNPPALSSFLFQVITSASICS